MQGHDVKRKPTTRSIPTKVADTQYSSLPDIQRQFSIARFGLQASASRATQKTISPEMPNQQKKQQISQLV